MRDFFKQPLHYLPTSGLGLDCVKLLAALLMVVDHLTHIGVVAVDWKVFVGRGVYPLFAYAVACHLIAGRINLSRNTLRLMAFGVLSQPLTMLLFYNPENPQVQLNILFTIMLSLFVFHVLKIIGGIRAHILVVLMIFLAPLEIMIEYGTAGIVLPSVFALAMQGKKMGYVYSLAALLLLNSTVSEGLYTQMQWWLPNVLLGFFALLILVICVFLSWQWAHRASSQQRIMPRFFLYWFYPLHLLGLIVLGIWLEPSL